MIVIWLRTKIAERVKVLQLTLRNDINAALERQFGLFKESQLKINFKEVKPC